MYSQPSLFESDPDITSIDDFIHGASYISDFISPKEEKTLLTHIDTGKWLYDLKRRVQHYGYKYDYNLRKIDLGMRIGVLPDWLQSLAIRLYEANIFEKIPDQVIVNEYEPGQGISPHIDCEPCFDKTIVSLSLNSTAVMDFTKGLEKVSLPLEPRSILILKDDARYEWHHCIPARKSDTYNGIKLLRKRRVSLTFRKVII